MTIDCGCRGNRCFHREHPDLPRQRLCRNAEYGKSGQMEPMEPMTPIDEDLPLDPDKYSHDEDWGAEPMDAVSAYPADMIPRVTIRESDDALTILMALRTFSLAKIAEREREAKRPGADQLALSLDMVRETQYLTDLMTAVTDGIIGDTTENTTERD